MISATFPYQKQRRRDLGREMAYVEVGQGDPIGGPFRPGRLIR
jgi:haloalkane dehalogenase